MPANVLDKKSKAKAKAVVPPDKPVTTTSITSINNMFKSINRCQIEICRECRKHTSCQQRPIAGECVSFESGPAWDHECEDFREY